MFDRRGVWAGAAAASRQRGNWLKNLFLRGGFTDATMIADYHLVRNNAEPRRQVMLFIRDRDARKEQKNVRLHPGREKKTVSDI